MTVSQDWKNRMEQLSIEEAKQDKGKEQPGNGKMDVEAYLNHYGLEYTVKADGSRTIYALEYCPFDSSHAKNDAAIFQDIDGKLGFHCFHDSCQGKGWKEAREAISGADPLKPFMSEAKLHKKKYPECVTEVEEEMERAKTLFPRRTFPWDVLPPEITESTQQLARACATSATALPGAAIAIFASVIGSTVSISPKGSWVEPLIFWFADIRSSGEGKTPAARLLCEVLYEAQAQADKEYKAALEEWNAQDKKSRGEPPARPRGYFVTDLTLEGLRDDHGGHGGKVIILDELSSFINSQNQYKKKGSDREAWLCLHDGKPARIVRVGNSVTLNGARISIFGGIQPQVWKAVFSGDDIYLVDGTVYRILPVYEGTLYHELTAESWSDENKGIWEDLLRDSMKWADGQQEAGERKIICLDQDAQEAFIDWRNRLTQTKVDLPAPVRGFIPKLVGYALRFAGVLYLMKVFCQNEEPGLILHEDDIQKGIKVSEFYLGHIIYATEALLSEDFPEPFEITPQIVHLARTLKGMESEVDDGLLAIGYIQERHNATCQKEQKVESARGMGSLLRRCGLEKTGGPHNANGRRAVKCLKWNEKVDKFIDRMSATSVSLQNAEPCGFQGSDIEKQMSAMSVQDRKDQENLQTLQTLKDERLHADSRMNSDFADDADIANDFSIPNSNEPPELVEI